MELIPIEGEKKKKKLEKGCNNFSCQAFVSNKIEKSDRFSSTIYRMPELTKKFWRKPRLQGIKIEKRDDRSPGTTFQEHWPAKGYPGSGRTAGSGQVRFSGFRGIRLGKRDTSGTSECAGKGNRKRQRNGEAAFETKTAEPLSRKRGKVIDNVRSLWKKYEQFFNFQ